MKQAYNYNTPSYIKNFQCLRTVSLWAGFLGLAQSAAWIALTIVGILAYTCNVPLVEDNLTPSSAVGQIIYLNYFKGDCEVKGYSNFNYTMLQSVTPVLDPESILIWNCVYLGVAVCWLLSSILLLTHLSKDNKKATIGVLSSWIIITLCIILMDLALGIIFGIDYGKYNVFGEDCHGCNLNTINAGYKDPNSYQLIAGMVAALSLLFISLKGFVLWIINFGLFVYLSIYAIRLLSDKDGNDTLFNPRKNSDILTTRPPILAYEEEKKSYANDGYVEDTVTLGVIELNQESIARAARMSTDSSLQDRRFRNIDAFQQYPPSRNNNQNAKQDVSTLPAPDYSPPMSRANGQSENILRNQRYH